MSWASEQDIIDIQVPAVFVGLGAVLQRQWRS